MDKEMINLLKKVQIFYAFFSKFSQKVKKVTKAESRGRETQADIFDFRYSATAHERTVLHVCFDLRTTVDKKKTTVVLNG